MRIAATVLLSVLLCGLMLVNEAAARGTSQGTVITNAKDLPGFIPSTPGELKAVFLNGAGVTNKNQPIVMVTLATVRAGYALSSTIQTPAGGSSGAGSILTYSFGSVTNWGNISDTFVLDVTNEGYSVGFPPRYMIYENAILRAGPSANPSWTSGVLAAGAFLQAMEIRVEITNSATVGLTNRFRFRIRNQAGAGSVEDGWPNTFASWYYTPNDSVLRYDTTLCSGPVVRLSKSVSGSVRPFEIMTYTIKYTNSGNQGAINMVIYDVIPSSTTYSNGSMVFVSSNGTVLNRILTDGAGGDAGLIDGTFGAGRVNYTFQGPVGAGSYGVVTFKVRVN